MSSTIPADSHIREVVEIEIAIPYGTIAAKWWGRRDVRPILCLHGLLDNAASFDTLIPLLPDHVGYLAIDLTGHGKSSRMPPGMVYTTLDDLYMINFITHKFGWNKVSLMGHSLGATLAFIYAATCPDRVDLVVALDGLQPNLLRPEVSEYIIPDLETLRTIELKSAADTEPPTYTIDEMVDKINSQTMLAVNKRSALYLLARAARESTARPGRWYFTADSRLKMHHMAMYTAEINESFARSIVCPFLLVKYVQSPYVDAKEDTESVLNVLMEKPNFSLITVDGDRYVHLNDPQLVCADIAAFVSANVGEDRNVVASKL